MVVYIWYALLLDDKFVRMLMMKFIEQDTVTMMIQVAGAAGAERRTRPIMSRDSRQVSR